MDRRYKAVGLGVMMLVLLLAIVSACAPGGPAPPPTEEEAKVKVMNALCYTGPRASAGNPVALGVKEGLDYYVAKHNIPVEVFWEESAADTKRSLLIWKRAKAAGCTGMNVASSDEATTLGMKAEEDNMIVLVGSAFCTPEWKEPEQWVFSDCVPYCRMAATFVKWVNDNWTDTTREPRFAAIIYDDPGARDGPHGLEWGCDKFGGTFVGMGVTPFVTLDTTTELLRVAKEKPDWLWIGSVGSCQSVVLKDIHKLGLREKGIKMVCWFAGFTDQLPAVGPELLDGYLHCTGSPEWVCDKDKYPEGWKALTAWCKKTQGWDPEDLTGHYPVGWTLGQAWGEAIRRAIEKVGDPARVTGKDVRDEMVGLRDFDVEIGPPATVSEETPWTMNKVILRTYDATKGRVIAVTDWTEPVLVPLK